MREITKEELENYFMGMFENICANYNHCENCPIFLECPTYSRIIMMIERENEEKLDD